MRILVTTDTYLPQLGGGEYHVLYLCAELRALGHTVTIFTTEKQAPIDTEVDVIRYPYKSIKNIFGIFYELCRQAKYCDVIHAHYSYRLSCIAAIVSLITRKPLVITQHGLGLLPQATETFSQKCIFRFWRYCSQKRATSIISTSEDLSVDIRALGFGHKIIPITNGYDGSFFIPQEWKEISENPTLLTVRRLVPKNGIQYLVAALPEICTTFPTLTYICVGDGRLRTQIEALATALGVQKHIQFLGAQGHNELLELYKKADVVVIPSTAESTSLSCIEAMALKKCIVSSKVGGLVELIGKNEERGYFVDLTGDEHCNYDAPFENTPKRIHDFAQKIISVVQNRTEAKQKAEAASLYAQEHFRWEVIARKTEQVLRDACLR